MPTANTFDCIPIADFVKRYLQGVSVDPFSRNNGWATFTNDLNPNTAAKSHVDAELFMNKLADDGVVADCVVLDPPYSPRQISECYSSIGLKVGKCDTQNASFYKRMRMAACRLCRSGTVVLSFGWNSAGMGKQFVRKEILLVAHGGAHNDTICVADVMP